jgi:hypothetical protein|tara:strand:+ start:377 stop:1063 length:687 start_codon:yes stop_codon:yes gene_type:complete
MPIVRLKMSSKLISSLMVIFFIATPYMSSAHDIPKPSFSLGTMLISDNAFNALAGTGVTIDDSDIVANFIVDYHVSPSLAFEGGVITSPEVSASLPSNDSGTLHGKSYSASGALTLKAKTDTSYFFGVKYSPSSTGALDFYGKAGLLFWDVDFSVSGSGTLTYNGSTYNSKTFLQVDGSDPFIGLGLSYEISKNTSFAFDYITTASTNAIEGVAFGLSGYSISWLRSF